MWPAIAAIAASAASDIGKMAFSARQAAIQRDFEERMRSSQYQTTVQDMQAAGLNPILAARLGGAGTPGVGMASTPASDPASSVASAASAYKTYQEGRKSKVEADVIEAVGRAAKPVLSMDPSKIGTTVTDWMNETVIPAVVSSGRSAASALASSPLGQAAGEALGKAQDRTAEAFLRVEDYLRGRNPGGVSRELPFSVYSAKDAAARSAERALPSGAAVGRRVPGQLDRLRLKRADRE